MKRHLHLRPIDNYWTALKKAVYAVGNQVESLDALQNQTRAKINQLVINISARSKTVLLNSWQIDPTSFK